MSENSSSRGATAIEVPIIISESENKTLRVKQLLNTSQLSSQPCRKERKSYSPYWKISEHSVSKPDKRSSSYVAHMKEYFPERADHKRYSE